MGDTMGIACIRFGIQLMISEAVFLLDKPRREKFAVRMIASVLEYAALSLLVYSIFHLVPGEVPLVQVTFWILLFAITLLGIYQSFEMRPMEVLSVGIMGYATEHISFSVVKIVQYVTGMYAQQIGTIPEYIFFRLLPYIMIAAGMYFLVVRSNKGKGEIDQYDVRLFQVAAIILLVAIVLSVYTDARQVSVGLSPLRNIICPLYGMCCCILSIWIEYYVIRENQLRREKETMEHMLQMAHAQQKSSKEAIDIINMKCHDLKHQMKHLMTMDDESERKNYLEEMRKAVSIYDATYHTGNDALDYILREKALLCDEYEITFSCMADGAVLSFLHTADIYALMGNALDNAIESAMKEEEVQRRLISLYIARQGDMVLIHLENTSCTPIVFRDGLPVTSKEDTDIHGFGVKSIAYLAKKYQGEMLMRVENQMFHLNILLPIQ